MKKAKENFHKDYNLGFKARKGESSLKKSFTEPLSLIFFKKVRLLLELIQSHWLHVELQGGYNQGESSAYPNSKIPRTVR